MPAKILLIFLITFLWYPSVVHADPADCRKHIELISSKTLARELGRREIDVVASHKINLWERPTDQGKGKPVGKLRPGSRAVILEESTDDYKVQSPYDKSIGWINKMQVKRTLKQDVKTREACK